MPTQSVLITGANGFIGSRLCLTFLRHGFKVMAGIRQTANRQLLDGLAVQYRFGDVTDPASLPAMVADADFIVHNAGIVKANSREQFFKVNGQGTANLMAAIAQSDPSVKRVVYISSQAVAGPSMNGKPVSESDAPNPVTRYGASKQAGEEATVAYKDAINVAIVRPAGVYGPGDKEVLSLFRAVNLHVRPLFGDVTRKVQMVHVDDVCRGAYLATVTETRSGSIYHIAEKQSYTIAEMVGMLGQATGKRGIPLRLSDKMFRRIAAISESACRLIGMTPMLTRDKCNELLDTWEIDVRKAKDELGFESAIPFAQGAKETYDWYREHGWM
jgi:nucleoside-diphosphate-sugar epimerase